MDPIPSIQPQLQAARHHLTHPFPKNDVRYTGLILSRKGQWLCPSCTTDAETAGSHWTNLHHFGWECFDKPPSTDSKDATTSEQDTSRMHVNLQINLFEALAQGRGGTAKWPDHFYQTLRQDVQDFEGVAYFANSPVSVRCSNQGKYRFGELTLDPCTFDRTPYLGHDSLDDLDIENAEHRTMLQSFGNGNAAGQTTSASNTYAHNYWLCLKCIARAEDLSVQKRTHASVYRWHAHIKEHARNFRKVRCAGSQFGESSGSILYCYLNTFANTAGNGLTCENRKFGAGPGSERQVCGSRYGDVLEYRVDKDQHDCLVARPFDSSTSTHSSPLGPSSLQCNDAQASGLRAEELPQEPWCLMDDVGVDLDLDRLGFPEGGAA